MARLLEGLKKLWHHYGVWGFFYLPSWVLTGWFIVEGSEACGMSARDSLILYFVLALPSFILIAVSIEMYGAWMRKWGGTRGLTFRKHWRLLFTRVDRWAPGNREQIAGRLRRDDGDLVEYSKADVVLTHKIVRHFGVDDRRYTLGSKSGNRLN